MCMSVVHVSQVGMNAEYRILRGDRVEGSYEQPTMKKIDAIKTRATFESQTQGLLYNSNWLDFM